MFEQNHTVLKLFFIHFSFSVYDAFKKKIYFLRFVKFVVVPWKMIDGFHNVLQIKNWAFVFSLWVSTYCNCSFKSPEVSIY